MLFAVQFYDVVLWLHISSVLVAFGSTFAYGVILATAQKSYPRAMPGILAGITANGRTVVTGGATLGLVTGLYLAGDRWDMSDFFVAWGVIAILVLVGMTHTVFRKNEVAAKEAAEQDIAQAGDGKVTFGPVFERANATMGKAGGLAGLIIILTIYVMTAKPFL